MGFKGPFDQLVNRRRILSLHLFSAAEQFHFCPLGFRRQ